MYIAIARHENIAAYKALRMAGIEPTEANMNRYIECWCDPQKLDFL